MDHVIVPCESAICYEMKQGAAARSRSPSRVSLRLWEERESFVNATVSRAKKINLFQGSVWRRGRACMRKRAGRTFHPESAWTHFRILAVQNRENGRRAVLSTISQFFPLFSLSFLWSQSGDLSVGMGRETRSNQSSSK